MQSQQVNNYDAIHRAYFKEDVKAPVFPEAWSRKTSAELMISPGVDGLTEDFPVPYFRPNGTEAMMHAWAVHCVYEVPKQSAFFITLDYVNDESVQCDGLKGKDFFSLSPRYMHLKSAIRYGLYSTPVIKRPPFAFSKFDSSDGVRRLLSPGGATIEKSGFDGDSVVYTVRIHKEPHRYDRRYS